MSKRKQKAKVVLSRADLFLARLCFFLALGISLYLAWTSLQGGGIPGCGPESDCDKVLSSQWAYLFGLPVSVFAAPVYAIMLALLWQKQPQWPLLLSGATVILLAALWFVSVQFFALRAFCKFCMAAHIAGAVAALVLLRRNPLPTRPSFTWASVGAAAAALLVAGQFAFKPRASETIAYGSTPASANPAPSHAAPPDPTLTILQGTVSLNLRQVPVHGRLDAPRKVAKVFDYTCHYCREMHHHFEPLLQQFSNELAVVSLAMPLDAACNHLMKQTPAAHRNACEYARLGLAVFYAEPSRSREFDDWVFQPATPPPVAQTRKFAENLVGSDALAKALLDPRIEQRIRENVNIYATNSRMVRSTKMPQLLFPDGASVGASKSVQDLHRILANALGLPTNSTAGNQ